MSNVKRVTLSFDLDNENDKKAYDFLNSNGRNKSRVITELILQKNNVPKIDYDIIVSKILESKEFMNRFDIKKEESDNQADKDFILNGINGFF